MRIRFFIPLFFFLTLLWSCKPSPEKLIVGRWKIEAYSTEDSVQGKKIKPVTEPEENYTDFFADGSYFKNSTDKTQNGKYKFLEDGKIVELSYRETGLFVGPEITEKAEVVELSESKMKLRNREDKIEVYFQKIKAPPGQK